MRGALRVAPALCKRWLQDEEPYRLEALTAEVAILGK